MSETNPSAEDIKALKNFATLVYLLQAATFGFGITYFLAPLAIYWKRRQAQGTWIESHLNWQLNTFWFSLAGLAAGTLAWPTPVAWMILIATSMWFVYRIGQGWTRLSRGQPIISGGSARFRAG